MGTDKRFIRLSLKYGLVGALAFPFIYESYANIMRSFAIVLTAAGCIYVGIRFSRFGLSHALCASVIFILLSSVLGAFSELMVHDDVVCFLEKRSRYFYMTYKEIAGFASCLFVCYLLTFIVCLARIGVSLAVKSMKKNSESAGGFIDNAFGDDDE